MIRRIEQDDTNKTSKLVCLLNATRFTKCLGDGFDCLTILFIRRNLGNEFQTLLSTWSPDKDSMREESMFDCVRATPACAFDGAGDDVEITLIGNKKEQGRSLSKEVLEITNYGGQLLSFWVVDLIEFLHHDDGAQLVLLQRSQDVFEISFKLL